MANIYVDEIASSLQEYNKANDPKGLVSYQVYSDLAWEGLKENNTKTCIDLPVNEKEEIDKLANRAALLSKMVPCLN